MIHYVYLFIIFYALGMLFDRFRRRDILYVEGVAARHKVETADKILAAYRKAGRRKPVVVYVPDNITIKRAPR